MMLSGIALLGTIVWIALAAKPKSVQAIPMFAKRTGASCELCHTVFPGMSNYGMMVMMSNFSMLPYSGGGDPGFTSFVYEEQYLSNPDGSPPPPKLHTENLGILNGGFIGPHFTYYLEQHIVDGGFIGGTDQMWISYNGLFGGTGSLQVGKFHTPFPFMPAHRITIAPYATTNATIGANGFNEDDSHWGITLSQMQGALMYSLSALGGNDLIGPAAFQLFGNHDHSIDFSLMTMSDQPLNYGVGLIQGFAPMGQSGQVFDRFSRSALYLQYIPRALPQLQFQAVGQVGFDADPFGTGAVSHTRGGFLEAQYHLSHQNWSILRWDTQNGDSPVAGLTLDFIHQVAPNAKITIEGRTLTTGTRFGVAMEWAGPWSRRNILTQPVLGSMPGMQMGGMSGMQMPGMDMNGTTMPGMMAASPSSPQMSPLDALLSKGDAAVGQTKFESLNCAACHGVHGSGGGIGPRLVGVAAQLQPSQVFNFIKHPHAPMPDFHLADSDIANLVAYVISLTPGHTVGGDIAILYGAQRNSNGMQTPMKGMGMMGMSMSMAEPPPVYPPEQPPLVAGDRGYFPGIENSESASGHSIYVARCQSCHGTDGRGGTARALDKLGAEFTPSHIAWHIREHANAPPLHLTNQEIADLVGFMETLDTKENK